MKRYRVQVQYSVVIEAETEQQAEEQIGELEVPENYIPDSYGVWVVGELPL